MTTASAASKWASKQYETLNKDFLFPDQMPTLRKEVYKKENFPNIFFCPIVSTKVLIDISCLQFSKNSANSHWGLSPTEWQIYFSLLKSEQATAEIEHGERLLFIPGVRLLFRLIFNSFYIWSFIKQLNKYNIIKIIYNHKNLNLDRTVERRRISVSIWKTTLRTISDKQSEKIRVWWNRNYYFHDWTT